MNIYTALKSRLSSRLGQAITVVILSTLVLRFPWLITSWGDEKLSRWVMDTANAIRDLAFPIILLFAKSFNETGGEKPLTPEAERRVGP